MSGLLDLPLELILDVVAYLSQREVIALSKCNKVTREAMQPLVMPGLAIKVDCSVRYQRDQTDKVALEAPIIHNGNIKAVCSAARDGLLDYYLGSVAELVIHERDAVEHRFKEPEDMADYFPGSRRLVGIIKAFDYFSPQYLATRLTALKKVFVRGDIRCLSSPLPKLNIGVFWQCLVSHCPDVECKVYVAPLRDTREYESIAMKNLAVFKHVAGLCHDVTFMLPACFDHVDKSQLVESFEVGDRFDFGLEIIPFDPQVLQRFDNLRSIHIHDPDLPRNLEQIVPNLEKLIVALDSSRQAHVDDTAPLTLHSTLKELVCERKGWGSYSCSNLLLFRFPNLSSFNFHTIKNFFLYTWKGNVEPVLLKTLGQSTKLETLKIDALVPANEHEALLKSYAFSESLRELTLSNSCATWLCSSSNDSPIFPELRMIELGHDLHTKHFLDGWDLDSFKILLQGFPKLELVLYPKDRESLGKSLDDDPKMQEDLKASAKVLSEPQGPTGSSTNCHQLLIQWAVWRYGRTSLVQMLEYHLNRAYVPVVGIL